MGARSLLVLAVTALCVGSTLIYVPFELGQRRRFRATPEETARMEQVLAEFEQAGAASAELIAWHRGLAQNDWVPSRGGAQVRLAFVWDRASDRTEFIDEWSSNILNEERVRWDWVIATQSLILLLGGGLLTLVVRRERRRRTASVEA